MSALPYGQVGRFRSPWEDWYWLRKLALRRSRWAVVVAKPNPKDLREGVWGRLGYGSCVRNHASQRANALTILIFCLLLKMLGFGFLLRSLWRHFWGRFWAHFWDTFEIIFQSLLSSILKSLWDQFWGHFWEHFWITFEAEDSSESLP